MGVWFQKPENNEDFGKEWVVQIVTKDDLEKEPNVKNRMKASVMFYAQSPICYFVFLIFLLVGMVTIYAFYVGESSERINTLMEVLPSIITLLFGSIGLIVAKFWHYYNQYGSKWQFAAKQYYELSAGNVDDNFSARLDLCIDILAMGIWADRALARFFFETLAEAIATEDKKKAEDFLSSYGMVVNESNRVLYLDRKNDPAKKMKLKKIEVYEYLSRATTNNKRPNSHLRSLVG